MRGRKPEISWQESQRSIRRQNRGLSGWALALYILYTAAVSVLLVYATAEMAADQLSLRLGEEQRGCVWALGLEILLIVGWNEVAYALGKRKLRWAGNLILLGMTAWGCIIRYHGLEQELAEGFTSIGQRYLDIWNRYYLTAYQLEGGSALGEPLAWGLLLVAATALLQTVSALLRKRAVLLLLPLAVLAAEMTVGVTPAWRGLACLSAAGLLGLYLDRQEQFQAVPALLLAALLGLGLPLTALVLKEPAARINLLHERLQAFQHQAEQSLREYDWQALWHREGQVDNSSPQYEHKEMLTVTVNTMPRQTMYLRGYYGTDYHRGSWDTSERAFSQTSLWHGFSGSRAAELLAELDCSAHASPAGDRWRYELEYTGLHDTSAYLPYGADLETVQEAYKLAGDYVVKRARSLESLSFEGWSPDYVLARDGGDISDSGAERFYMWYNEFVQDQYMQIPGNMPELTDVVNSMEIYARTMQEQLEAEDAAVRNAARLYLGSLVASQLQATASYSLEPGSLPRGTDPVEYFLGENRKGYCAHFASAGVLILRGLGVPARYVSGYAVFASQFTREGGSYVASVKDDCAHAWAEIWLDNVGWVPVEMTPGYHDAEIELSQQVEQAAAQLWEELPPKIADVLSEEMSSPSPQPAEEETEEQNELERNTAQPTEGAAGVMTQGAAGVGEQQGEPEGWGFEGEGGWAAFGQNGSLRISHVALALLGMAAVVWMGVRGILSLLRRRVSWQDKARADIENGNSRRVVRLINRRLYRRLWRKRAGMLTLRSDEEYLAALKQHYPQISGEEWEEYLEVVRKAVYSRENILPQEAGRCLSLLTRI